MSENQCHCKKMTAMTSGLSDSFRAEDVCPMTVPLPSCIMHGICIKMIHINLYSPNALSYNKFTCWMYAYALARKVVSENLLRKQLHEAAFEAKIAIRQTRTSTFVNRAIFNHLFVCASINEGLPCSKGAICFSYAGQVMPKI